MNATRTVPALLVLVLLLPGCAITRHGELKRVSRRVESRLQDEQSTALRTRFDSRLARDQRLDHLTSLRYTLSAANVGLATVPRLVPEPQRPMAYDVLEEVYSTIDWNIPLGPGDALRPLPDAFSGGVLDLLWLSERPAAGPGGSPTIVPIEE
ncbi:MAG: hypothetical protein DHS20C14_22830 [Phycisphaeraceae bacterium]|nr:MAG: hypothetical protein DHS20C14_22830 [Phycisphaeraceae bacterium]